MVLFSITQVRGRLQVVLNFHRSCYIPFCTLTIFPCHFHIWLFPSHSPYLGDDTQPGNPNKTPKMVLFGITQVRGRLQVVLNFYRSPRMTEGLMGSYCGTYNVIVEASKSSQSVRRFPTKWSKNFEEFRECSMVSGGAANVKE